MSGPVIALDAMGGDVGPQLVVAGAGHALARFPELRFRLYGQEALIRKALQKAPAVAEKSVIVPVEGVVQGTDKVAQVLRRARETSMGQTVAAVKSGDAQAAVSAGNTGALMAMAKLALRTMSGIDRPALCTRMPTLRSDSVVLDLGANTECDANNLVQFAIMGAAFARTVLDIAEPTIALLNIGVEDMKGTGEIRTAANILRDVGERLSFRFVGNVEGNDISSGEVDVIVTDGFSGNIALKTAEGTARLVSGLLNRAYRQGVRSKLGYLFSRPALDIVRQRIDPNNHNGAVFLGLNGIVVKSHGSATAKGFANAIGVAYDLVTHDIAARIRDGVESVTDGLGHDRAGDRPDGDGQDDDGPVTEGQNPGTAGNRNPDGGPTTDAA